MSAQYSWHFCEVASTSALNRTGTDHQSRQWPAPTVHVRQHQHQYALVGQKTVDTGKKAAAQAHGGHGTEWVLLIGAVHLSGWPPGQVATLSP